MQRTKLIVVSKVRNEGDIIESFSRYALSWCDELLIWDDGSTDDTREILRQLVAEGLPILVNEGSDYRADTWRTRSVKMIADLSETAFQSRGADLVIPLDADEFLISLDGGSPRTVLQGVDPKGRHRIRWRTYLCDRAPSENATFLPEIYAYYRGPAFTEHFKVILTRHLYYDCGCFLAEGNHSFVCQREPGPKDELEALRIAHYPIRDPYQSITKAVLGELGFRLVEDRGRAGDQWGDMYTRFKSSGWLSPNDLRELSLLYEQRPPYVLTEETKAGIYGPIDVGFSGERITLKYTDYGMREKTFLQDLVSGFEKLTEIAKREKEVASLRVMSSKRYKVGAAIIDGLTSMRGLMNLPATMARLFADVWRRPPKSKRPKSYY